MKKNLKRSLVLTIIVGIFWIIMPEELRTSPEVKSTVMGFHFFNGISISRFWDLTIFSPVLLSIYFFLKEDKFLNPMILLFSMLSPLLMVPLKAISIIIFLIIGILVYIMCIQDLHKRKDNKGKVFTITGRALSSVLTVLFMNTLIFGILNGLVVCTNFLLVYLILGIITEIIVFLAIRIGKSLGRQ